MDEPVEQGIKYQQTCRGLKTRPQILYKNRKSGTHPGRGTEIYGRLIGCDSVKDC